MASGTIISQVRTSDAYLPIENATVAYYETGAQGGRTLVGLRKTDSSGKTAPMELQTPDSSASQRPEEAGDPCPYRIVDIIADHPDYNRVNILGVQVFDGIVTNQDIMLLPSPESGAEPFPGTRYDTSDQDL